MADAATIAKIDEAFAKLAQADSKSLLKKHLTKELVDQLKKKKTKLGASLLDVIQSGVANLDAGVGVYAPDAESYKLFAPLLDKIIEDYHGFKPDRKQKQKQDLGGKTGEFPPLDPEGKFIVSTRIRCDRSVLGYPFNPMLQTGWVKQGIYYASLEMKLKKAFDGISDNELKGKFYSHDRMMKENQTKQITDHFLFKEGDRHLQEAGLAISLSGRLHIYPKGRCIFHNKNKTFLVWVNEEDHIRIISMEQGSDVGKILDRLIRGVKSIEVKVKFSRDDRLGWLTFCPTNLGLTVRASVHIKLPKLAARKDFLDITNGLKLQVRGIHGEHSESEGGVFDISNKAHLGLSEYEAVKQMYEGVKKLIELEQAEK